MKLSPRRALELRRRGIDVPIDTVARAEVAEVLEKKSEETPDSRVILPDSPLLASIVQVAEDTDYNFKELIKLNATLVTTLSTLAKPKEKKKWSCTIGRNSRGEMSSVDIQEQ